MWLTTSDTNVWGYRHPIREARLWAWLMLVPQGPRGPGLGQHLSLNSSGAAALLLPGRRGSQDCLPPHLISG